MNKQLRLLLFILSVICLLVMSISFLFFPFYTSAGYLRSGALVAGMIMLLLGACGGYGLLYFLNRSRIEYLSYIRKKSVYLSPFSTFARNEQARKVDKALLFVLPVLVLAVIISRTSFVTWLLMGVTVFLINAHIICNGEVARYCGVRFDPIVKHSSPVSAGYRANAGRSSSTVNTNRTSGSLQRRTQPRQSIGNVGRPSQTTRRNAGKNTTARAAQQRRAQPQTNRQNVQRSQNGRPAQRSSSPSKGSARRTMLPSRKAEQRTNNSLYR